LCFGWCMTLVLVVLETSVGCDQVKPWPRITFNLGRNLRSLLGTIQLENVCEGLWEVNSSTLFLPRFQRSLAILWTVAPKIQSLWTGIEIVNSRFNKLTCKFFSKNRRFHEDPEFLIWQFSHFWHILRKPQRTVCKETWIPETLEWPAVWSRFSESHRGFMALMRFPGSDRGFLGLTDVLWD
jgi:hypothetical protein